MQLEMGDVKLHTVEIEGVAYTIRIGYVPNGFWWKCAGGFDCDGVKSNREVALADAIAEIKARSL